MTRRVAPLWARALLGLGALLFWVVQLGLMLGYGMPITDSIVLAALLVVLPVTSVAQLPLVDETHIERLPAYWASIITLWLLGTATWLVGTRDGGNAAVGLVGLPPLEMVVWSVGLTAGALGIIALFRWISVSLGVSDPPLLRRLLPQTAKERRVFGLLSLAAGVGEEMAFRGYAIGALTPVLGTAGAVVVSTLVFGVVHAYQGVLGVLRTGLMGGMLAAGFLLSGSLWPAIIAHVLIDIIAGILLADRLLTPSPNGPEPPPHARPEAAVDDAWK